MSLAVHPLTLSTLVEQQVTPRGERVSQGRRRPVTDTVTGDVPTEMTVEVVETAEVPTIEKHVRLRDEIVVRTERIQRVETVREMVRRDGAEIRQPRARHLAVARGGVSRRGRGRTPPGPAALRSLTWRRPR